MTTTKPKPKAPPAPVIDRKRIQLLAHRTTGLIELGFSVPQTLLIVRRNDVVHEASELLSRRWPHDWVVDELVNRKDSA